MPEGVGYGPQSTASVGKDIHVIGDHAYAFSGLVSTDASNFASHLDFTSGNYLFVGNVSFMGPTKKSDTGDGANAIFQVTMNGVTIMDAKLSTLTGDDVGANSMDTPIIIPPYSSVTAGAKSGAGSQKTVINITGRLYK